MIYANCLKRVLDFMLSLFALIVLSPVLLLLTVVGAAAMGGNPFFTQDRPGKNERIFKLVKFRTMTNKKDKNGKLLPDDKRLTATAGSFARPVWTSCRSCSIFSPAICRLSDPVR